MAEWLGRADLKSGDPKFKSRSDLFEVVPGSTPRLHLYIVLNS